MPENPLFPSLDLEARQAQIDLMGPAPAAPDFTPELQNMQQLYYGIAQLKSQHPLNRRLRQAAGKTVTGEDFLFPSLKAATTGDLSASDMGPTFFDPVAERYDRYAGSKYFKDLGFVPGRDNEELYGRAQSTWEAIGQGIGQAFELGKFQFVDQLKGWGRLVDGIFSGDLDRIFDQGDLEQVNQQVESILNNNPIFLTQADREGVFTGANLASIVGQSGFTLGALTEIMAEELLLSALSTMSMGSLLPLQAARTAQSARAIGQVLRRMNQLENAVMEPSRMRKVFNTIATALPVAGTAKTLLQGARQGENTAQFALRGFGAFYRDLREANAAFTEARAETSGTYAHLKQALMDEELQQGSKVDSAALARIEQTAKEAAEANFWANAAIIGISNRIQFNNIFRGFKGAARHLDEVGGMAEDSRGYFRSSSIPFSKGYLRTLKALTPGRTFRYFQNNITEALQENLQSASDEAVRSYYLSQYRNPGSKTLTQALNEGIAAQLSTQGAKTFLSGFLTGAITTPVSKGFEWLGERVSTTPEIRKRRRERLDGLMNTMNGYFTAPEGRNAAIQASLATAMGEAIKARDQKGFMDLRDDAIRSFVRTGMETGKLESMFDRLEGLTKGLSKEEFEQAFGIEYADERKQQALDYVTSLRQRSRRMQDQKSELDFRFGNPFQPTGKEKAEDLDALLINKALYEEAKWQVLYMQDAHLRTLDRQRSLLQETQAEMRDVEYSALLVLQSEQSAKAEIKVLKEELKVISDIGLRAKKEQRLHLLEALLPGIRKGELHADTLGEYLDHVQSMANKGSIDKTRLADTTTRLNDFFALKGDEVALFNNINRLVDPQAFSELFRKHTEVALAENLLKALRDVDEKFFNERLKKEFPHYQFSTDDQGNPQVTGKDGQPVAEEELQKVMAAFERERQKDADALQAAEKTRTTDLTRLQDIYSQLAEQGTLEQEDRDWVHSDKIKAAYHEDANFIKIHKILATMPAQAPERPAPPPPQPSEPPAIIDDEDAYPYVEGSPTYQREITSGPAKRFATIIQEVSDKTARDANGDLTLEGGYAFVRGAVVRAMRSRPELFEGLELVLMKDNPAFYEHGRSLPAELQELLGVTQAKQPYDLFLNQGRTTEAPVVYLRNPQTRELVYFNPYDPDSIFATAATGVIAAFPLNLEAAGVTPAEVLKFLDAQPNGEFVMKPEQVEASPGLYYDNGDKLKNLNDFQAPVSVDERGELHISKGLKHEYWNHPENERNGGTFLQIGALNRIKLLPSKLSAVVLPSEDATFSLRALFAHTYTNAEADQVLEALRVLIYSGPWKPKQGDWEQIVPMKEVNKEGKVVLKLVRNVDPVGIPGKWNFRDSKMTTETVLNYILKERRINVKDGMWSQDLDLPYFDGEGRLRFYTINYREFLEVNLFTNKARSVHPATGKVQLTPVNNRLIFPPLYEAMGVSRKVREEGNKVAAAVQQGTPPPPTPAAPPADAELAAIMQARNAAVNALVDSMEIDIADNYEWDVEFQDPKTGKPVPARIVVWQPKAPEKRYTAEAVKGLEKVPFYMVESLNKAQAVINEVNTQYRRQYQEVLNARKAQEQAPPPPNPPAQGSLDNLFRDEKKDDDTPPPNFNDLLAMVKDHVARNLIGKEELQFIRERFGDHVLNHMAYAANSEYWGYWKAGVITLFSDAAEGTGYHEAWHHFSQVFLNKEEKQTLYQETLAERPELKTPLQAEEYLANRFRDYMLGDRKQLPVRKSVFEKILDFFAWLFRGLSGPSKSQLSERLDKYFEDLAVGNFAAYRPSLNHALWGRLNYGFIVEREGTSISPFDARQLSAAKGFFLTMVHRTLSRPEMKDAGINLASLQGMKRVHPQSFQQGMEQLWRKVRQEMRAYVEENRRVVETNQATFQLLTDLDNYYNEFFTYALRELHMEVSTSDFTEVVEEPVEGEALDAAPMEDPELSGDQHDLSATEVTTDHINSDHIVPIEDQGLLASLSKVMRSLMLTLPKAEPVFNDRGEVIGAQPYKNHYGLTEPCDPYRVINILGEELAGLMTDDKILAALHSPRLWARLPEAALIAQSLPQDTEGKPWAVQMLGNIVRDFNRVYVPVYSLLEVSPGNFILKEQTKNTIDKIRKEWQDTFLTTEGATTLDPQNGNRILSYDWVQQHFHLVRSNFEDRLEFLASLGIVFSDRTRQHREFRALIESTQPRWFAQKLLDRMEAGERIDNPVRSLMRSFVKADNEVLKPESDFLGSLLDVESRYSDRTPSNMYKTVKGTNKYALMLPNWFNLVGNVLRGARTRREVQVPMLQHLFDRTNYYARHNFIMRSLFSSNGERQSEFIFGDYNSARLLEKGKPVEKQTTEMTGREKLVADLNALLRFGAAEIMRTGNAKSAYFYKLSRWRHTWEGAPGQFMSPVESYDMPFNPQTFTSPEGRYTGDFKRAMEGYFFNLLLDEVAVMRSTPFPEITGTKDRRRLDDWGVFQDILKDATKSTLLEAAAGAADAGGLRGALHPFLSNVMGDVYDYLDISTKAFTAYAATFGIEPTANGRPPKQLDQRLQDSPLSWAQLAKFFVLNDFVLNVEFSRVFTGVPQLYKDYHKRAKAITSTGNTMNTGQHILEELRRTHSYTMAAALGRPFNPRIDEVNTSVMAEDITGLDADIAQEWREAARLYGREAEMEKILSQYAAGKINVNDGQAWSTFDFYRRLRLQVGNWNMATDEIEYRKVVAKWKLANNIGTLEERALLQAYVDRYSDKTYATFPVLKLQYNGPQKAEGLMRPILHKFSVAPLIPTVYRGTDLEDVHNWMLQTGRDYVTAKSGSKNYNPEPLSFWANAATRQGFEVTLAHEQTPPQVLFAELLKEQIKTNPEVKDESTWGTQLRSLFLSNAFNDGISTQKLQRIFDEYLGGLDQFIELERQKLFEEFGIEEQGETIRIVRPRVFIDTLQQQAKQRKLNRNVIESLELDPVSGEYRVPLEIVTNRQAIVDLVGGIIYRRLIAVKVNGDMLIQVASTGTRRKLPDGSYERELAFYRPIIRGGKLVGTRPAECKVGFNKHYYPLLNLFHPDGKLIKVTRPQVRQDENGQSYTVQVVDRDASLVRLNESLRSAQWMRENGREVTLVGYRIPTQEPNSMEFMTIREFLPEEFGSCVIMPREIVVKAGSDYDVDKQNVFRPYYGADGKLLTDNGEEVLQSARELQELIDELTRTHGDAAVSRELQEAKAERVDNLVNTMFESGYGLEEAMTEFQLLRKRYHQVENEKRAILVNKAVSTYMQVLSDPMMFFQLIRPNNTENLTPLAEKMAQREKLAGFNREGKTSDFKNTKIFEYQSNHVKFLQNTQGQSDLGLWALLNKMAQNLQLAGARFNKTFAFPYIKYRDPLPGEGKDAIPEVRYKRDVPTTPFLLTPQERALIERGGAWAIGLNRDILGRYKQKISSELINATVDIEKDPFYIALGINNYNRGIASLLLLYGIPIERISYFLRQPILKEYYHRLQTDPLFQLSEEHEAVSAVNVHARLILSEVLPPVKQKKRDPLTREFIKENGRFVYEEGPAIRNGEQLQSYIAAFQKGATVGVDYEKAFSEEELWRNVGRKEYKNMGQAAVLLHFLALNRMQKVYRQAQQLVTTDTKKVATPIASELRDAAEREVRESGLFQEEGFNRLLTRSYTSPFTMKDVVRDIFEQLMPYGFDKRFNRAVAELIKKSGWSGSQSEQIRLEKTFANDFMSYIVLELGNYQGRKLKNWVWEQINKRRNPQTLAERLRRLRSNPRFAPLFRTFALAEKLHSNASTRQVELENVELVRGLDNSVEVQDVLIEDFRRLVEFRPDSLPNVRYSATEAKQIRDFFRDIAVAALGVSGFNKSLLYMTDVLPLSEIHPIAVEALKVFRDKVLSSEERRANFLTEFLKDFGAQNPKVGIRSPRKKNPEPWRGKYLTRAVNIDPAQPLTQPLQTYKGRVRDLGDNGIFVFGSNTEGRHGAGAALEAKNKFGAILGQARGLQGRSYALVTKDLKKKRHPSITPEEILAQIEQLYAYAKEHPEQLFYVAYSGKGKNLNGYTPEQMAELFATLPVPGNMVFEAGFADLMGVEAEFLPGPSATEQALAEAGLDQWEKIEEGRVVKSLGISILEGEDAELIREDGEAALLTYNPRLMEQSLKEIAGPLGALSLQDYTNYQIYRHLATRYMNRKPTESEQVFLARQDREATERMRYARNPEAYSQVLLAIPDAYRESGSSDYESFKANAVQLVAAAKAMEPFPQAEHLSRLFEQMKCL